MTVKTRQLEEALTVANNARSNASMGENATADLESELASRMFELVHHFDQGRLEELGSLAEDWFENGELSNSTYNAVCRFLGETA